MYISPNYGGSHLMLLGGSAVQQANNQMNLGAEALDLFNRPISSAQAIMDGLIEAFPENAEGPAARGSVRASKDSEQAQDFDYDAWIDKMIAFQKAANSGLNAAATAPGSTAVLDLINGASTGDGGEEGATGTDASGGTEGAGNGDSGAGTETSGSTTGTGDTSGSGNTGQTSGDGSGGSGGGLLGGLLGGLFGR